MPGGVPVPPPVGQPDFLRSRLLQVRERSSYFLLQRPTSFMICFCARTSGSSEDLKDTTLY